MYSVLISVYNKEKSYFLNKALNSLVNQTLIPGEIIIVKDGELTIELDEVIDAFCFEEKTKVKVLNLKKNVGLGKALELGLLETNFDIVARMDSDDIMYPDRLEKQYNYFLNNEVDMLGTGIQMFYDNGKKSKNIIHPKIIDRDYVKKKKSL